MKEPLQCFGFFMAAILMMTSFACAGFDNPSSPTEGQTTTLISPAKLTEDVLSTQGTLPTAILTRIPPPTLTSSPTAIATIARTAAPSPLVTPVGECNQVGAGNPFDITIPDDSGVLPGQAFTKTWRVVNVGSCKWTRLYKLVYYSGNPLGAQQEQYLTSEVLPGYAVDLSVNFVAPEGLGSYQSNWMLQSFDGVLFGLGMNADGPFWVRIQVMEKLTPTFTPTITITPTETITVTP